MAAVSCCVYPSHRRNYETNSIEISKAFVSLPHNAVHCKAPNFLTPLTTGVVDSGVVLLELTTTTGLHWTMCQ